MNPGLSVTKTHDLVSFWRPGLVSPAEGNQTSPRCVHLSLGPHVIPSQDHACPSCRGFRSAVPMSAGGSPRHHPRPAPAFAGWEPPADICRGDFNPLTLRSQRAPVRASPVDSSSGRGWLRARGGLCWAVYYYSDLTSLLPSWIQSNARPQGGAEQRRGHGHARPKAKFPDSWLPGKCSLTLRNWPHSSSASFDNRKSPNKETIQPQLCWLPRWSSGKESTHRCRRRKRLRCDPWVRKIPWRKKWQPTPVFLPGESHGQRSLAGYSPWGRKSRTWIVD